MQALTVDMTDPASIRSFADQLAEDFPALNVVVNNAGIMRPEKLMEQPEAWPTWKRPSRPTCWARSA